MDLARLIKHLSLSPWKVRHCFAPATLDAIEQAVHASEHQHRGELKFVVEGRLPLVALFKGVTARQRAEHLFARLGIGDTAENSGILIYVQLADRQVEILADRGIARHVAQAEWDAICRGMEQAFKQGDYRGGALAAIARASTLLAEHFPAGAHNPDEISNRPLLL